MEPQKSIISTTGPVRQKTYSSILQILNSVIFSKKYADILITRQFKSEYFSSSEKAAVVEHVYGILRHRARIDHIIEHGSTAVISSLELNILNVLRICTYQAVFKELKAAAVITNSVALSAKDTKHSGFVKRTVEAIIRNKDTVMFPDRGQAPLDYIATYHSHPLWIVEKWARELPGAEDVEALCQANDLKPPLTIRVNPLKTDLDSLKASLEKNGYATSESPFSPFGLIVHKKEDIFKTEAFGNGDFEVQDEGSQLITLLTAAKPGECVIDACAGNGGKTLFLSGLMKNKGVIVACDTIPAKLVDLKRRANRAGASNIKTLNITELADYRSKADCVLIDAPCSGMGVFRRNPDSKWRLGKGDILELSIKQKEILRQYSILVKPGGRLVYATCTISLEENENVVRGFLDENKDFYLVSPRETDPGVFAQFVADDGFFRSMPHVHNTDGFFSAVMMRKK
ncbi:MAG: 16S rRNA (cytosine(967)-C(5))-methyltransferase RsmB [ANME-2 cluster archaeon]|nr:16S rRNA (cytosine(967)-C(5))-methyltransferase RsmB [ANME-2 cluster archaeon]